MLGRPGQMDQVIPPFLEFQELHAIMALCHKVMTVDLASLRASKRWLRIYEWCTWAQSVLDPQVPSWRPSRAPLANFGHNFACCVVFWRQN